MPKVSVIVPIYNIKQYLEKCIESILNQTLQDIEIILVDDGSTDGSGVICDIYAQKDSRIKVIHKQNEGLSCARNDGIDASVSPYIMFVDGDDWVEPSFCENPFNMAQIYHADLVMFAHKRVSSQGEERMRKRNSADGLLSESQAMCLNVHGFGYAWLYLYRRQLFDHIRFPAGRLFEDVGVTHRLIHEAERIYFTNLQLYDYRVSRPGSITTERNTKFHQDRREMSIVRIRDFVEWNYEECALSCAINLLVRYGGKSEEEASIVRFVHERRGCTTKNLEPKQKLMLIIFRFSRHLFDAICFASGKRER